MEENLPHHESEENETRPIDKSNYLAKELASLKKALEKVTPSKAVNHNKIFSPSPIKFNVSQVIVLFC